MAEKNGQNKSAEWSPVSFRALRDALKRPGIVTLNLWADMPELSVDIDMSGIAPLTLSGKMSNQMIADHEEAVSKASEKLEAEPNNSQSWREITSAVLKQHDYILGAVIIRPKYYMLDEYPDQNSAPDDGITVWDFTPEMRWAIVDVLNKGGEAFANFRKDPIGYATALSERGATRDAGESDTTTGDAVVDQNAVQSGDLATGDESRSGDDEASNIKEIFVNSTAG